MKYLSIVFLLALVGCVPEKTSPKEMKKDGRTKSEILRSIFELQAAISKRDGYQVAHGVPVSHVQKKKVIEHLSDDFVELYEFRNGSSHFGISFTYYSIEDVASRPELDLLILSDMQSFYSQLSGDESEYACFGSEDSMTAWYHRPTSTIFVCGGGESVKSYKSVKDWLVFVEEDLQWLHDNPS